jgi:membrane fusion protein, multidrug efflux system
MIKRFLIAIVLLVLVCGGIVGFNLFRDKAIADYFANAPVPSVTVSTAKVEPATWRPTIEAIGTVSASRGVDLTVEVAGVVKSINFKSNQAVKAGDVLVQLDDAVEQADLRASQAQGQLNEQTLQRAIELQQRGVGSDVTLDQARAAAANSASQIDRYQAVVDQKQLRAPFSGTAGIPKIEAGQYIQPGTVVATLQDLETMRADFSVPEQQLPLLKIDQRVRYGVTTDKLDFEGAITGIEPKVDPVSRLVTVRAEVRNVGGRLSPGQFVQVRVELPEEPDVLAIPQTALVSSLYGDYVYLVRPPDQKAATPGAGPPANTSAPAQGADAAAPKPEAPKLVAKQIFVKAGRRAEGRVEIAEGVKSGDEVVTAGQNRLSNNAPVAVDNSVTPGTAKPGQSPDELAPAPPPDAEASAVQ